MRVDVQKVLFIGLQDEKESFFKEAQRLGILEFIRSQPQFSKELPASIQHLLTAEKIIRKFPLQEQQNQDNVDVHGLALRIEETYNHLERAYEQQRLLKQELARVEAFGCFDVEQLKKIQQDSGREFSFFFSKKPAPENSDADLLYLGSVHHLFYYVRFSQDKTPPKGLIEMKVEKPLQELSRELHSLEEEIAQYLEDLTQLASYQKLIHQELIHQMNHHSLSEVKQAVETKVDHKLFSIEAWLPKSKLSLCSSMLLDKGIMAYPVATEQKDRLPTYLENQGLARVGEDLVQVYDTPSISDKDPSPWVLWAFALFFGIIIGDGGYGLLFLAASLVWHFQGSATKGLGARMVKLALILSSSCVLWGLVTTSFFGMKLDIDHPIRKLSPLHALVKEKVNYHFSKKDDTYQKWVADFPVLKQLKDPQSLVRAAKVQEGKNISYPLYESFQDQLLMEMAILIGVIHLSLSFMRMLFLTWSSFGWMMALIGGYLYFPVSSFLSTTSLIHVLLPFETTVFLELGQVMIIAGIALALLLSVFQNGLSGLFDIANLIQIFSDVLSYLRLYALGLAGGMVSQAFNQMGMDLIYSGAIGMMFGPFVIVIGHLINIVLALMGGVIHGLRLNFLEWYHYCFEGGGKMFRPLKLIKN